MRLLTTTPVMLAVAVLLGACASGPTETSLLSQDHAALSAAQSDATVVRYAPLELKQAGDALALADASAAHHDSSADVDKLAYLAQQKIALAREAGRQKAAEADVAAAAKQRDQVLLAQRTQEADRARGDAEQARNVADQANQRTQAALSETNAANQQAAVARRDTVDAQAAAARLEAQLADLSARKTERGIVITMGDVLFAVDVSALTPQGQRTADKLAEVLQQNPGRTVAIEGFTDSTGTAAYNQALSERRAEAVGSALAHQGIARTRIATHGFGETRPVAGNDTAANRQLNRRVEIVLSNDSTQVGVR